MSERLYLTGASGLLGRAIYKRFCEQGWDVYGTAFSRAKDDLHKVDLLDQTALEQSLLSYKPTYIIHSAAQRFPDKVETHPEAAEQLNVLSTKYLAEVAAKLSVPVLYISTDYVFDGTSPPYKVCDKPNPLNLYGKLKHRGEEETLKCNARNLVLRIPVLYGPVETLSESAVTVLLQNLMNACQQCEISNYEIRCPSHVDDIALICFQLATKISQENNIQGIYHWCGKEKLTKYNMIECMAEVFELPMQHVKPNSTPPKATATPRPYDTTLDTSRLEALQIGQHTPFKEGIYSSLKNWIK